MQKPQGNNAGGRHVGSCISLDNTQIKLIALVLMFIDHAGATLLPYGSMAWTLTRTLGRLSFPLYAYLTAQGIKYTHNIRAYAKRLLIYAFLSEIPFDLAFFGRILVHVHQNVFFTLALSAAAFWAYREKCYIRDRWTLATCIAFAGILAQFLHSDYGIAGVFLIGALVCADGNRRFMMAAALCFLFEKSSWIANGFIGRAAASMTLMAAWMWVTSMDNGRPGDKKWRKWFYVAYPAHLAALWMLRVATANI